MNKVVYNLMGYMVRDYIPDSEASHNNKNY